MRFRVTETDEGRTTMTTGTDWLLTDDPQGRLTTASSLAYLEYDGHENRIGSFTIVRLARDAAGKINEMKRVAGDATYEKADNRFSYEVTSSTFAPEPVS